MKYIIELSDKDIGSWVTYKPNLENERGRILRFDNDKKIAWVVYKANNNWDADHWKDCTAAATNYRDLYIS